MHFDATLLKSLEFCGESAALQPVKLHHRWQYHDLKQVGLSYLFSLLLTLFTDRLGQAIGMSVICDDVSKRLNESRRNLARGLASVKVEVPFPQ